MTETETTLG